MTRSLRHVLSALTLFIGLAGLSACATRAAPEALQSSERRTLAASPDAVFKAARSYYEGAKGYKLEVIDTDARLLSAYTRGFPTNDGPLRREIVWIRPGPSGPSSTDIRVKATWGANAFLDNERPADLAAHFEALALGRTPARKIAP